MTTDDTNGYKWIQLVNASLCTLYVYACSVVVLDESPCPGGSSRTNLQVLVLVLGPQSS